MPKAAPKIKHIAIMTMDPKKAAKFYCDVFEMEVVHRNEKGNYFISDGYITVALLRNVADGRQGKEGKQSRPLILWRPGLLGG